MEAQACGLPAIVTSDGGPKETVEHGITGLVLKTTDPLAWCNAIKELLDNEPRRRRMSQAAAARMRQFPIQETFESFWNEHLSACGDIPKQPAGYSPTSDAVATTLS
jgi:glycosyltransferase involved in cell wall biosynthesis